MFESISDHAQYSGGVVADDVRAKSVLWTKTSIESIISAHWSFYMCYFCVQGNMKLKAISDRNKTTVGL